MLWGQIYLIYKVLKVKDFKVNMITNTIYKGKKLKDFYHLPWEMFL